MKDSKLERQLSERLTVEIASGTPEYVEKRFENYIKFIKENIDTYDKILFKLNISNYAEYRVQFCNQKPELPNDIR